MLAGTAATGAQASENRYYFVGRADAQQDYTHIRACANFGCVGVCNTHIRQLRVHRRPKRRVLSVVLLCGRRRVCTTPIYMNIFKFRLDARVRTDAHIRNVNVIK